MLHYYIACTNFSKIISQGTQEIFYLALTPIYYKLSSVYNYKQCWTSKHKFLIVA